MKLYVGNLNFRCTEDDLRNLFEPYGPVTDLIILNDRETGRSRGFGFVTLGDDTRAQQAVEELAGKDFLGRDLVLNEAQPRTERPAGSTHGDGPGRGYGNRGNSGGNSAGGYSGGGYSGGGGGGGGRPMGGGYKSRDDVE